MTNHRQQRQVRSMPTGNTIKQDTIKQSKETPPNRIFPNTPDMAHRSGVVAKPLCSPPTMAPGLLHLVLALPPTTCLSSPVQRSRRSPGNAGHGLGTFPPPHSQPTGGKGCTAKCCPPNQIPQSAVPVSLCEGLVHQVLQHSTTRMGGEPQVYSLAGINSGQKHISSQKTAFCIATGPL